MNNQGYIRYHRKILDNPIVMKDADYFAIWSYLLLKATHKKMSVIFKGKKIELQPGQLITGRKIIANDLKGISESKIYRVLSCYESEQQIEQQKDTKNTLITIVNWCNYQKNEQQIEQQLNNKWTTTEQQLNTNNNVNNEINEINIKEKDKKENDKIHFADFVTMTNVEYESLVNTYGNDFANQCITVLDNYKGSSGKKYKSDYRAILSWVVDSVKKKNKDGNDFKTKHERSKEILKMEREKIRRENEQRGSN